MRNKEKIGNVDLSSRRKKLNKQTSIINVVQYFGECSDVCRNHPKVELASTAAVRARKAECQGPQYLLAC